MLRSFFPSPRDNGRCHSGASRVAQRKSRPREATAPDRERAHRDYEYHSGHRSPRARRACPMASLPPPDYPPMWLQAGKEVAVVGTRNGHAVIMGYGGLGYRTARVIAEDGGIGAPDGSIVDLAASPDGMVLALAVANPKGKASRRGYPRCHFRGRGQSDFQLRRRISISVSIGWLGEFTIPSPYAQLPMLRHRRPNSASDA